MSLILEALRKLEREKQSPDAGLVVVGHTPWTGGSPGRSRSVLILLAVALVAGGIGLGIWLGRTPSPVPNSQPAAAAAVPPPTAAPAIPEATPARGATADASAPSSASQSVEPATEPPPATEPAALPLPRSTPSPAPPVRTEPARAARVPDTEPEIDVEREVPAAPQVSSRGELKLQAISQRDGHPIAVINERLVREGESFDGVLVVKIGKAEVEVEVAGRRRTLTF